MSRTSRRRSASSWTAELRRLPGYDKTPVFVLTSDVSRARFAEGRQVGATAWLVKPPNLMALVTAVREALAAV